MATKSFLEKEEVTIDEYWAGGKLNFEKLSFHRNQSGLLWIPAFLDNLEHNYLEPLHESFNFTNEGHWVESLNKWVMDERYFLGNALSRNPTDGELVHHYDYSGSKFKFKLDYLLRNPQNIIVSPNLTKLTAELFLARADIIGRTDFSFTKKFFPSFLEDAKFLLGEN